MRTDKNKLHLKETSYHRQRIKKNPINRKNEGYYLELLLYEFMLEDWAIYKIVEGGK